MNDPYWSFFIWLTLVTALIITTIVIGVTWSVSTSTIATNCEKLGGFYVNNKTYKCELTK
jgi:multisubunit Na+/H+ antiporter MnhC subunit